MLPSLYETVEARKLQLEEYIRKVQALFKPWPPPGEDESNDENPKAELVKKDEDKEEPIETLSVAEQAEVDMVDRLLSKAKKALEIQKKVDEPKKSKAKHSPRNSEENIRTKVEQPDRVEAGHENKPAILSKKPDRTANPQLKLKSENKLESNTGIARKAQSAVAKVPTNLTAQKTQGRTRPSVASSQGTRVVEKQSSASKSRIAPAHMNAPFQTNPRLTSNKMQTTYRAATSARGRGRGTIRGSRGGHCNHTVKTNTVSVNRTELTRGDNLCDTNSQQMHRSELVDLSDFQLEFYDQFANTKVQPVIEADKTLHNNSNSNTKCVTQNHSKALTSKFSDLSVNKKDPNDTERDLVKEKKMESHLFDLRRDGSQLSIPPKLRRYFSNNTRLLQKLFMKNVTTKVNSPTTARDFPRQLQHVFGEENDIQAQSVARNVQHVMNTYTNLYRILGGLCLSQCTESSTAADIFHTKKVMEFILQAFEETELLLHNIKFSHLKNITVVGKKSVEVRPPQITCLSTWYPNSRWPSGFTPSSVIRYRSVRELEKYCQLQHQSQLLQLQMDTMDTVAMELIPLLQSLDPTSSEFVQVLRSGYSLLSLTPSATPVVVKDTIEELDDSIVDNT